MIVVHLVECKIVVSWVVSGFITFESWMSGRSNVMCDQKKACRSGVYSGHKYNGPYSCKLPDVFCIIQEGGMEII